MQCEVMEEEEEEAEAEGWEKGGRDWKGGLGAALLLTQSLPQFCRSKSKASRGMPVAPGLFKLSLGLVFTALRERFQH